METFRPGAVVLQMGADSLSGDKLGGFNLTLQGELCLALENAIVTYRRVQVGEQQRGCVASLSRRLNRGAGGASSRALLRR